MYNPHFILDIFSYYTLDFQTHLHFTFCLLHNRHPHVIRYGSMLLMASCAISYLQCNIIHSGRCTSHFTLFCYTAVWSIVLSLSFLAHCSRLLPAFYAISYLWHKTNHSGRFAYRPQYTVTWRYCLFIVLFGVTFTFHVSSHCERSHTFK